MNKLKKFFLLIILGLSIFFVKTKIIFAEKIPCTCYKVTVDAYKYDENTKKYTIKLDSSTSYAVFDDTNELTKESISEDKKRKFNYKYEKIDNYNECVSNGAMIVTTCTNDGKDSDTQPNTGNNGNNNDNGNNGNDDNNLQDSDCKCYKLELMDNSVVYRVGTKEDMDANYNKENSDSYPWYKSYEPVENKDYKYCDKVSMDSCINRQQCYADKDKSKAECDKIKINNSGNEQNDPSNGGDPNIDKGETYDNYNSGNVVSCGNKLLTDIPKILPKTIHLIYLVLEIVVPLLLIIFGSIDFVKAIIAQKDDEIKKGQQVFLKRLIVGVVIFFVFSIVKIIVSFAADSDKKVKIINCASCFINNDENCEE